MYECLCGQKFSYSEDFNQHLDFEQCSAQAPKAVEDKTTPGEALLKLSLKTLIRKGVTQFEVAANDLEVYVTFRDGREKTYYLQVEKETTIKKVEIL